jgi:subtilase family serine protease
LASPTLGRFDRRRSRACRPEWVPLERRLPLTRNIALTDAFLEYGGQQVAAVSAGQEFHVEADFTTRGLPSGATYRVTYTVDGLSRYTGLIHSGAGRSGKRSWSRHSAAFIASPGTNQVTVSVDPNRNVPERSYADNSRTFSFNAASASVYFSYSASQIRAAYDIDNIPRFGSVPADGSGQTIAIVDAYNAPDIIRDLQHFDRSMRVSTNSGPTLLQRYGPASSILKVYNQQGENITARIADSGDERDGVPPVERGGSWEGEEALDVEWVHAIAPGAKIDLVECEGREPFAGLFRGAATAARLRGVSVVSMSWIFPEGASSGEITKADEQFDDSRIFVTPRGHRGVTFLAGTGDTGTPAGYPAYSPNVVAVGGTQLILDGATYQSETGWSFPSLSIFRHGGSDYSQSGTWQSTSGGFSGNYGVAAAGANSSATWTIAITSSDKGHHDGVEVAATWVALAGNATNATYSFYDGPVASGKLLGQMTVDQARAPVGIEERGSRFQDLGVVYPRSSTLTVVLDADSANGTVVADAVGITAAAASGGGRSRFESEPSYQDPIQTTGYRTTPDVSFDGSRYSGVTVYEHGHLVFGTAGTSLSAPCWAGLIAIADQERVARGGKTFNNIADPTQTLDALYSLPEADFHDITSGYNGLFAGAGYDEVTGRGSPVANLLVPDLAAYDLPRQGEKPGGKTGT